MLDPKQFTNYVIIPSLNILTQILEKPVNTKASTRLMLLTALTESRLEYIKQINGPAASFYQIEQPTFLWITSVLPKLINDNKLTTWSNFNDLYWDMQFATFIARTRYWLVPQRLPNVDDGLAFAKYHKAHYNTYLGKADPNKTVKWWPTVVECVP